MGWNGLIFNGIDVPKSLINVTQDWEPLPLGTSAEVIKKLNRYGRKIVWENQEYGSLVTDNYVIEFNIDPEKNPLECIGVRISGEGDPFRFLRKVCTKYNWGLYDSQVCDLVDFYHKDVKSWKSYLELAGKII